MTPLEYLADIMPSAVVFQCPTYEKAIIGTSDDERIVYDYSLMLECLMEGDKMTYEEARDFIFYNTLRSIPYMGSNAPIVVFPLEV